MHDHANDPDLDPTTSAPTRRALFGGLVLAAGGLLLPAAGSAREGHLGGRFGGRRGPDRRGRDKGALRERRQDRRDRGDDGAGNPPGFTLRKNVEFEIHNFRGGSIDIQSWYWNPNKKLWVGSGWGSFQNVDTRHGNYLLAVQLGDTIVRGENPQIGWPEITIGTGGWDRAGWNGGVVKARRSLAEGESVFAPLVEVIRLDDSDDYKRFRVNLLR